MADFDKALAYALKWEGVYSIDPDDPGGETYCGISRKHWPDWIGWDVIDKAKKIAPINDILPGLAELVGDLYRTQFWNPIGGDGIADQDIATYKFDTAVNLGVSRANEMINTVGVNLRDMIDWRTDYYIERVCKNPALVKYLRGWRRRATRRIA